MTVWIIGSKLKWNCRHDWNFFHHQIQLLPDRLFTWHLIGCSRLLGVLVDKLNPLGLIRGSRLHHWVERKLHWGLCALEMSGAEEVVCEGWLRKSPPEKKLRRYVSSRLVVSLLANINTQKCSFEDQKKCIAFCPTLLCLIVDTLLGSFWLTQYLKSHSKGIEKEKKK